MTLLADLFAPPRCAACDARVRPGVAFCPPCASTVERAAHTGPDIVVPLVYGGALARAIARFKYEDRPDLARALAAPVAREVLARGLRPDRVVPVPLHGGRLVARGYDQSALLAAALASALGAALGVSVLARERATEVQATLGRAARAANVAGAFACRQPARVAGAVVLLVDDVRTTGATHEAAAGALRTAGARRVLQAAIARADGV